MNQIVKSVLTASSIFMSISVSIFVSTPSQAQSTVPTEQQELSLGFQADLGELIETGVVANFTDKYNGYQSARVEFNAKILRVLVTKSQSPCKSEVCPTAPEQLLIVNFDVDRVERRGCFDSYYAHTPKNLKSEVYEQIIVQRRAIPCRGSTDLPAGTLHYRITGVNSETDNIDSTDVFAPLLNLKPIQVGN